MSKLQQILLELESPYAGHPYYVSGNALLHSVSDKLSYEQQRELSFSHGFFTPSVYGVFPNNHSKNGGRVAFGANLKPVKKYEDLFVFRQPSNKWIHDGRAREAFNTHDLKVQSDKPIQSRTNHVQSSEDSVSEKGWYLHFYVTGDVPIDTSLFDGIHLGADRNYGYGEMWFKDSKTVDIDSLDYSSLKESDSHVIELLTPYVLSSEHPKTDEYDIPWWWDQDLDYRQRKEVVVEQREKYELETVDHGQVTAYGGDKIVETAKTGIERTGNHSKYGYGEFMVRPA